MMSNDEQTLFSRVAGQVAATYCRRCPWADQQDLEQEAWAAMLEARGRFDPTRCDLGGYLYGAAQRAVHRAAWRQGSPLSVSQHRVDTAQVFAHRRAAVPADEMQQTTYVVAVEETLDRARARERIASVVGDLLAADREADAVMAVISGEATSSEAAAAYGVALPWLYRTTHKVRRAIEAALAA